MILPYINKLHSKIEVYFDTNKIKNKSKVKTISKPLIPIVTSISNK
jgi:hypothetical protein